MEIEQPVKDREERKSYLSIISWIPAVIMMIIIFLYSAKPAEVSEGTSTPIAKAVLNIFEYFFGTINHSVRTDWLDTANFIVRKTAHVTEYMVLTLCISWPLWIRKLRGIKLMVLAFVCSVAYAGTDEFHQLFVEGRSGSLRDVGIDAIGCAIGTILFWFLANLIEHKRRTIKNLKVIETDLSTDCSDNQ